jgi:hypothetical protein
LQTTNELTGDYRHAHVRVSDDSSERTGPFHLTLDPDTGRFSLLYGTGTVLLDASATQGADGESVVLRGRLIGQPLPGAGVCPWRDDDTAATVVLHR